MCGPGLSSMSAAALCRFVVVVVVAVVVLFQLPFYVAFVDWSFVRTTLTYEHSLL